MRAIFRVHGVLTQLKFYESSVSYILVGLDMERLLQLGAGGLSGLGQVRRTRN